MTATLDAKQVYEQLDWDEKRKVRIKIGSLLSKHGKKGLDKVVRVGEETVLVYQMVKVLRFKPRQSMKPETYDMAILLHQFDRKISRAFFHENLMYLLFHHPSWIKPEHEPIIKDIIRKSKSPIVPSKPPSTKLQTRYVAHLYSLYSRGKTSVDDEPMKKYCRSDKTLMMTLLKFAYKHITRQHPEKLWDHQNRQVSFLGEMLKGTSKIEGTLSLGEQLLMNIGREAWSEVEKVFNDVDVIKDWPIKDRQFLVQIAYIILKDGGNRKVYTESIYEFLSTDEDAMTKFFLTFFDGKIMKESWPDIDVDNEAWSEFFCSLDMDHLKVDAEFLLKKGNEKMLKFLCGESSGHAQAVIEYANLEQLIELSAMEIHDFLESLYEDCPRKLMVLLRSGHCATKLDYNLVYNLQETFGNDLTDLDELILMLHQGKTDIAKALYCLANGRLPQSIIAEIDKLICKSLGEVPDNNSVYEYFNGSTQPSIDGLAKIPVEILGDNSLLCRYIVKKAWDVMKTDAGRKWPWNQTVATAIALLPDEF